METGEVNKFTLVNEIVSRAFNGREALASVPRGRIYDFDRRVTVRIDRSGGMPKVAFNNSPYQELEGAIDPKLLINGILAMEQSPTARGKVEVFYPERSGVEIKSKKVLSLFPEQAAELLYRCGQAAGLDASAVVLVVEEYEKKTGKRIAASESIIAGLRRTRPQENSVGNQGPSVVEMQNRLAQETSRRVAAEARITQANFEVAEARRQVQTAERLLLDARRQLDAVADERNTLSGQNRVLQQTLQAKEVEIQRLKRGGSPRPENGRGDEYQEALALLGLRDRDFVGLNPSQIEIILQTLSRGFRAGFSVDRLVAHDPSLKDFGNRIIQDKADALRKVGARFGIKIK
jgi:hypothetical protein